MMERFGWQERLCTERLRADAWLAGDEAEFVRMNADSRVMRYFPRPLAPGQSP